jgi:hypothetical protein
MNFDSTEIAINSVTFMSLESSEHKSTSWKPRLKTIKKQSLKSPFCGTSWRTFIKISSYCLAKITVTHKLLYACKTWQNHVLNQRIVLYVAAETEDNHEVPQPE